MRIPELDEKLDALLYSGRISDTSANILDQLSAKLDFGNNMTVDDKKNSIEEWIDNERIPHDIIRQLYALYQLSPSEQQVFQRGSAKGLAQVLQKGADPESMLLTPLNDGDMVQVFDCFSKINLLVKSGRAQFQGQTIRLQYQLARALDVAPGTVSNWKKWHHIPNQKLQQLKDLYEVPIEALLAEDSGETLRDKLRLDTLKSEDACWKTLLQQSTSDSQTIKMEVIDHVGNQLGVYQLPTEEDIEGPIITFSQAIRVSVHGSPQKHLTLLLKDPEKLYSLSPSKALQSPDQFSDKRSIIIPPRPQPPVRFRFNSPIGQYYWVAILSDQALDKPLYTRLKGASEEKIRRPEEVKHETLQQLVQLLEKESWQERYQVFYKAFAVMSDDDKRFLLENAAQNDGF